MYLGKFVKTKEKIYIMQDGFGNKVYALVKCFEILLYSVSVVQEYFFDVCCSGSA